MKNRDKEIERFIEEYKRECKSGLKLLALMMGIWVLYGAIIVLIFFINS